MNTQNRTLLTALWITGFALASLAVVACSNNDPVQIVGTLERDRVELSLDSSEPIVEILVNDGARVETGQVILIQDPARHRALLNQRQAEQDRAQARLAELIRGPRPEQIAEARARLQASEALTRRAMLAWKRQDEIVERGVGDQASLDNARENHQQALATEQADQMRLEELLNGTTREALQQAEADLAAALARTEQAAIDLNRTKLLAPVSGTLDKVWFETGERPATGVRVAVILDDAHPFARVYIPEPQRASVMPGTKVNVKADGFEQTLTGTVRWVSSDASFTPYFALTEHDRSRLSYLAEIDLPDASQLPSGLPLAVQLD